MGIAHDEFTSAYDRNDRGRGRDRRRCRAMMLARWRPGRGPEPGQQAVSNRAPCDDPERARRFREMAMPHFDDVYTLARYLLRNATDAEAAAEQSYLPAFKHFDGFPGPGPR